MPNPFLPPAPRRLRDVVHSARFAEELLAIEPNIERMDEKVRGVEWVLSRMPEEGRPTNTPGVFACVTGDINDGSCLIFYSFDKNRVVFESILAVEESEA